MKILCVEDNVEFADQLTDLLKAERYTVDVATDGQEGWELAESTNYDLILLDIMLPRLDGIRLCQQIRRQGNSVPVLLLTARGTNDDKVLGLDSGADDYLVKPVGLQELMARIRALLRRGKNTVQPPILEWGDFRLDPNTHEVKYGELKLLPTPKEYALLELFLRNSQQTFSRNAILENLWSLEADIPGEDTVKCHIKGLRNRLKAVGAGELIQTLYGLGYRLNPQFLKNQQIIQQRLTQEHHPQRLPGLPQSQRQFSPLLLLVTVDQNNANHLSQAAASWGLRTVIVPNTEVVNSVIQEVCPDILIFDLDGLSPDFYRSQLADLRSQTNSIPLMIWANDNHALADRIAVTQLGATHWLSKSTDPNQVMTAITQTLRLQTQPRILWVEDEPLMQNSLQEALQSANFQVAVLSHSIQLWKVLSEFKPDLVILNEQIAAVSGIEICQALRSDLSWNWIPVMILTSKDDLETVHQIFAAGANDYVAHPVMPSALVQRIRSQCNHSLIMQNQLAIDRLTGTHTRQSGIRKIETLINLLPYSRQTLSLAVLEIDPLETDDQQLALGDRALCQVAKLLQYELNREDVIIRWSDSEWVVGLYATRNDAVNRFAEILETLRQMPLEGFTESIRISFSAGVAQFSDDGTVLQELYENARSSLHQAQLLGGDRVLPTGWKTRSSANPTIALVHPDSIFSDAVLSALETRGYSHRWLSSQEEAIAELLEATPRLLPQVIVMAGNLPNFQGLDVLKALSKNKITQMVKVMAIVADSKEAEKALRLGADDYIMTPCSPAVLIQQLNQVLGG
jgi:diguanylate cyclase (GGDEF)-like protein